MILKKPSTKCGKQLVFPKLARFSMTGGDGSNTSEIRHLLFIFDKDGLVDSTPNLVDLKIDSLVSFIDDIGFDFLRPNALSRWTRLTHFTIRNYDGPIYRKLTSTLVSLGEGGMRLKHLDMTIVEPTTTEWSGDICSNLSHFFATQAQSLQILKLELNFDEMEDSDEEELLNAKIQLPVFPGVHTFNLDITMCPGPDEPLTRRIFEMDAPLPVHFPKLDNLEIYNYELLSIMYPEDVNISVPIIPLRFLKLNMRYADVRHWGGWKRDFGAKIRSVETLHCLGKILEKGEDEEEEEEIPWKDSLTVLKTCHVKGPLNIAHMKNLRELILSECLCAFENLEEYLSYFDQVLDLNLTAITFQLCKKLSDSDEDKERFIGHFPFSVKFN